MTVWEFGLDEQPFAAIVTGAKTIEGRLNRGKFAQFAVGDVVKVRRDYRDDNGNLQDGQSDAARVEIVGIRQYMDFLAMVAAEGHEKVSPGSIVFETWRGGMRNITLPKIRRRLVFWRLK